MNLITLRWSFILNEFSNCVDLNRIVIYFQTTLDYYNDHLFWNDFGLMWRMYIFNCLCITLIWCDGYLFSNDCRWRYAILKQLQMTIYYFQMTLCCDPMWLLFIFKEPRIMMVAYFQAILYYDLVWWLFIFKQL